MRKIKVLFLGQQNGIESQMAEAWLNHLQGDLFQAESAGLHAGELHPLTIEVMKEVGIELSNKSTQSLLEALRRGPFFGYVITVSSTSGVKDCPIFPGVATRLVWTVPDPSGAEGTLAQRLEIFRITRDVLKTKIEHWCQEIRSAPHPCQSRFKTGSVWGVAPTEPPSRNPTQP
jgi:arsenate reductase